jgi:hypothetical protein
MARVNKASRAEFDKAYRKENHVRILARDRARSALYYDRARAITIAAKSVPCMDCGGLFPWVCMDFDHVRGKKLFNIAEGMQKKLSVLLAEIAKCDVVCSNCHRIRTHKHHCREAT